MCPRCSWWLVVPLLVGIVGCDQARESASDQFAGAGKSDTAGADESRRAGALDAPLGEQEIGQAGQGRDGGEPEPIRRQIIYRATLDLVVEDFTGLPEKVEQLARQHEGFVAGSTLYGSSGSPRNGSWTIRVPVSKYGTFLDAAKKLGEFESLTTESQEVTAEYYDVQTRIRNRKKAEERLLQLLEESTGKLEDVVAVEEHLSRVREEIERLEGRMRVLKDLTAFSTITLNIREIQGYEPPEAATLGERISRSWSGSLAALVDTGENALVGLVAVVPWLPVIAVPLVVFVLLVRMLFRRRRAA